MFSLKILVKKGADFHKKMNYAKISKFSCLEG